MKTQKLIILVLLFVVGIATAVPTQKKDHFVYSQSLNSIAAVIMNWYGSLIDEDKMVFFSANTISNQQQTWLEYRSQYPKNITQVLIKDTQLLKLGDDYQFKVNSKIVYLENNELNAHELSETFIFKHTTLNPFVINSVTLNSNNKTDVLNTKGYDRKHYRIREFTYAWLSYLNGVDGLNSAMNANAWLNLATYSLEVGAEKHEGTISNVLTNRKQTLAKGGHLLQSLNVINIENQKNMFILELIIQWKGVNISEKPVIARIHQIIKIKINADKSWKVISIKEKHLLPAFAPWVGLLC